MTVDVRDVSIRYIIGDIREMSLKEYVIKKLRKQHNVKDFWAVNGVSFTLEQGDFLGIVGTNGSGKSTLLKAIAGIFKPSKGSIRVNGNVAALLELGTGFDGEMTVRENTMLRGALLGYTRQFIHNMYDEIINFAELEEFQDRPFRQLSSGMKSKLAFSISSLVRPDILILDEVLSVGDGAFIKKSEDKMMEIIKNGATTIFVSHSTKQVEKLCNKVLWIEKGEQVAFGESKEVCRFYEDFLKQKNTSVSRYTMMPSNVQPIKVNNSKNDYEGKQGIVIQCFGRFFAGILDMNLERWFKIHQDFAEEPYKITGVSPFSIIGTPDPALQKYAESGKTNTRIKADIRKNFDMICEKAHADWLVVDNTSALIALKEINGQFYSVLGGEKTDFIDDYFNNLEIPKRNHFSPANEGFSERLKNKYDLFIDTVLRHYDSSRIILIRSHVPRYRSDNGKIEKTKHREVSAAFISQLDDYFINKTGCRVLDTPSRFFEVHETYVDHPFASKQWDLQHAIENDVINKINNPTNTKLTQDKYTFDDIAGIFYTLFHERSGLEEYIDKENVGKEISQKVLLHAEGSAYLYTKSLFEKNKKILSNYQYCMVNIDNIEFEKQIIVRLDMRHFLEVSTNGIREFNTLPNETWNYISFIDNDYTCGIEHISDALESFETYFERGRRKSKKPFILQFADISKFIHSLYFIDYEDILSNENYVIALEDSSLNLVDYKPRIDLAFLFEERTRVCRLSGGLADQVSALCRYKEILDQNNLELYVNDLIYDHGFTFTGLTSSIISADNIEPRRLSNLLSKKLRFRRNNTRPLIPYPVVLDGTWHDLGLKESCLVTWASDNEYENAKIHIPSMTSLICKSQEMFESAIINKIPQKPCFFLSTQFRSAIDRKDMFERYFKFPDIIPQDVRNYEFLQIYDSRDVIAIHLRRGDQLTTLPAEWKHHVNYKNALEMVYSQEPFDKYTRKHLLVFSDDMEWVKTNYEKLGLNLAGEFITFVDWNHHFDSFRDMHLMSMCKVIIRSIGSFAYSAGLLSKTVEYIIRANDKKAWIEWERT